MAKEVPLNQTKRHLARVFSTTTGAVKDTLNSDNPTGESNPDSGPAHGALVGNFGSEMIMILDATPDRPLGGVRDELHA